MIVGSVLSSPRRRRRLAWIAGIGLLAVAVVVGVKTMPDPKELPPETFSKKQAQDVLAHEHYVKLAHRDRTAINTTLDRFVPAAVARKDPAGAYAVSSIRRRRIPEAALDSHVG